MASSPTTRAFSKRPRAEPRASRDDRARPSADLARRGAEVRRFGAREALVPPRGGPRNFEQDCPTTAPLEGDDPADGRDVFAGARHQLKAAPALSRSVGGPQPDVFRGG